MSKNKFTATLEIQALTSTAKKNIEEFGDSLQSAWEQGNTPKSFLRDLEKMRSQLGILQEYSDQGYVDETGAKEVISAYNSILKTLRKVRIEFGLLSDEQKLGMLSAEEATQLAEAERALKAYNQALERNAKARKAAEGARLQKPILEENLREAEAKKAEAKKAKDGPTQESVKEKYSGDYSKYEQRAAEAEATIAKLNPEIKSLEAELAKKESAIRAAQDRIAEIDAEIASLDRDIEARKAEGKGTGDLERKKEDKGRQKERQERIITSAQTEAEDTSKKLKEKVKERGTAKGKKTKAEKSIAALDEKVLAEFNAAAEEHKAKLEELEEAYRVAEAKVLQAANALKKANAVIANEPTETADVEAAEEFKEKLVDLEVVTEETEASTESLTEAVENLREEGLEKGNQKLEDLGESAERARVPVEALGEEVDETNEALKEQQEISEKVGAFKERVKALLSVSSATEVVKRSARDAIETIKELDAAMVEMAVVTDLNVSDYWNQLPNYTKRANDLGLAIQDVYQADTLFYQQGLKTNEVVEISTQTMKMARIAGLDTATATDRMTAALRGFNMELNEANAQNIADVYSKLAAITASDVDEISSAMTKTASIAASAGMEFETTAAFLSQIIETTRESAETAGTAMKTVIARFQELKKDPAEIGEVDGEIVDANKIETALRSVGVALRDSNGQFRDLDDVFLELSEKWNTLDKNTQRYIATIAAGSRQQSRFIAMMSDYSRTQELVSEANNSAGASNEQFEKTMEGLEAKINKLKNAWHEFTMGILDSTLVKTGVDILTKFLEIINKMTNGLGEKGLFGSVTKLLTIFGVFKMGMAIFKKFESPLTTFFKKIVSMFRMAGEESGREFVKGAQQSSEQQKGQSELPERYERMSDGTIRDNESGRILDGDRKKALELELSAPEAPTAPLTFGQKVFNKTGIGDILSGVGILRGDAGQIGSLEYEKNRLKGMEETRSRDARLERVLKAKDELTKAREDENDNEALTAAIKEFEDAKRELDAYDKQQRKVEETSQKAWDSIGQGIGKVGQSLTAVGIGLSTVGGIMSSLGFEEAGETISDIGQAITLVGGAIMAIPPLITAVQAILAAPPLGIILIIITAVIAALVIVSKIINNMSAEKKLEEAAEAAEEAANAADEAAEAYNKLAEALDSLDEKYKALEKLTEGTKEWNDAVRDINYSVLELIDQYPELARLVENKDGVLTIDIESEDAQAVLKQAETRKIIAKNNSISANAAMAKVETLASFGELEAVDRVAKERGKDAFTSSVGAGALGGYAVAGLAGVVKGAILGAVTGAIVAPITAAGARADDELQKAVDGLASGVVSGEVGNDYESMYKYLTETMGVVAEEAELLADEFSSDINSLLDYGRQVDAANAQQRAAFEAIAQSAQSLANTLTMTDKQIKQSRNLVDDETAKMYYEEMMGKIKDEDFTGKDLNDYDGEYRDLLVQAVKDKYGSTAKLGEDGTVSYEKEGVTVEVDLDNDQIRDMIATQYATKQSAYAIEQSDEIISKLAASGGDEKTSDAVNAMFMAKSGGALTWEQLETLKGLTEEDYQQMWKNLSKEERSVYGNDINRLKEKFKEAITGATKNFEDAGDSVRGFMSSGMAKTFKDKLEEVAGMAGGEAAAKTIQEKTDALLAKRSDEEEKQSIQNRINATDWTNLEELLALQIDLQLEYGYTAEEAEAYVKELGKAAFATSNLNTSVRTFGELWKATERINQTLIELNDLQWKYNRALQGQGSIISELVSEMLEKYKDQAQNQAKAYEESNANIARIYAQGMTEYSVDLTQFVKLGENGIDIDRTNLDEAIASGKISEEDAEKWLEKLSNQYKTSQEYLDGLKTTLENVEALEQQGKDSYRQLRDMVKETISTKLTKQIELQQESINATKEANARLVEKIQEQINDQRQARENEKAQENIANLRSQQAYLAMDSSGASALEMLELDEQIAQAEQDYQDSLIDQTIQNLTDANEEAYQQRERQIDLAQKQLEAYLNSSEYQQDVDSQLEALMSGDVNWKDTLIGQAMTEHFTQGMTSAEATDWAKGITAQIGNAENWLTTDWGQATTNINNYLDAIAKAQGAKADNLTGEARDLSLKNKASAIVGGGLASTLDKAGYTVNESGGISRKDGKELDNTDMAYIDSLSGVAEKDSNTGTLEGYMKTINEKKATANEYGLTDQANKFNVQTKEQFYNFHTFNAKKGTFSDSQGTEYSSYADYLQRKSNQSVEGVHNLTAMEAFGGHAVSGSRKYLLSWRLGEDFDVKIGGKEDDEVDLGGKADSATAALLEHINNQTGGTGYVYLNQATTGKSRGIIYIRESAASWWPIKNEDKDWNKAGSDSSVLPSGLQDAALDEIAINDAAIYTKYKPKAYKTGGLADFTGPAWLDGTKSKPELVLNQRDTANFIVLKDILSEILTGASSISHSESGSNGDNYYDIEINVDSIEDDYDVEQLADKIRRMIYEDASYRNVNAINNIR